MELDSGSEVVGTAGKLVRYSAHGRHYSPAARLQIVEESYPRRQITPNSLQLIGVAASLNSRYPAFSFFA